MSPNPVRFFFFFFKESVKGVEYIYHQMEVFYTKTHLCSQFSCSMAKNKHAAQHQACTDHKPLTALLSWPSRAFVKCLSWQRKDRSCDALKKSLTWRCGSISNIVSPLLMSVTSQGPPALWGTERGVGGMGGGGRVCTWLMRSQVKSSLPVACHTA